MCKQKRKKCSFLAKKLIEIVSALNVVALKMLQMLWQERLDVTTIGKRLGVSQAYVSEQVRALEDLGLVNVTYERGRRGIKKFCRTTVEKIVIVIAGGSATFLMISALTLHSRRRIYIAQK